MRLAVFDTNVVVSAGIAPNGPPARLLVDWVLPGKIQLVLSPGIRDEYREVAARAKFRSYGFPPAWLEYVVEECLLIPDPMRAWPAPLPDASDAAFLAVAKAAGAWLITGNLKHYPRAARLGVKVVSPAEYLNSLESDL